MTAGVDPAVPIRGPGCRPMSQRLPTTNLQTERQFLPGRSVRQLAKADSIQASRQSRGIFPVPCPPCEREAQWPSPANKTEKALEKEPFVCEDMRLPRELPKETRFLRFL